MFTKEEIHLLIEGLEDSIIRKIEAVSIAKTVGQKNPECKYWYKHINTRREEREALIEKLNCMIENEQTNG
jgi:hypothetical protein